MSATLPAVEEYCTGHCFLREERDAALVRVAELEAAYITHTDDCPLRLVEADSGIGEE